MDPLEDQYEYAESAPFTEDEIEDGKTLAVLAYIPFLCFIPFVKAKGKNEFAYHHGKQGLLLFLFEVIIVLVMLSWKVAILLASVAALAGMIYALMGKIWKVPYIGDLADRLDKTKIFEHTGLND